MSAADHRVVVVAYDDLCTFEFGVAVEVFGLERPELSPWYKFSVCSFEAGPLRAKGGFRVEVDKGIGALRSADTVIIPGWRGVDEAPPDRLLRALRRAHERGARLLSFCSGAFVLAAAGILDERSAATHWRYTNRLQRDYPTIDVNSDALYVEDDGVFTAAGSAAAIDLCLHVVRQDHGASIANVVARRLVVPPHRDGGQAQFVDRPMGEIGDSEVGTLMEWVRKNLDSEHSVPSLANKIGVSERTLDRRFHEQAGTTPMRWLAIERVAHAQELLETTTLGVEQVARKCGFGSAQLLRFHFRRVASTTPTAYRRRFRGERE